MEVWPRRIAALAAPGLALYWDLGLESAQNSLTGSLELSGQVVVLIWLLLAFLWAFAGALAGYAGVTVLQASLAAAGSANHTEDPMPLELPRANRRSASALMRALPVVAIIAVVLALGFMFARQLGLDSRQIHVADALTGGVTDYRIVTVLPRDAIAAITDPRFASASEALLWMNGREPVIGLEIGGETRAYPISMLSSHEIVNDVVGGVPVAVTW